MYLAELYKHNKILLVVVLLFVSGQLFINFKRGMVITPFFHYGMYSEVMRPAPMYDVWKITVNGTLLERRNFSPWLWDKLLQPVIFYSAINKSNELYEVEIKQLMEKLTLTPNSIHFLSACNDAAFEQWYINYMATVLKHPVKSVLVQSRQYKMVEGALLPTNTVQSLYSLCR